MARQLEWAALYKIDPANIAEVKIMSELPPWIRNEAPRPRKMGEVNESLRPITINGQDYRGAKTNPNFNADHQGFDVDDIPGSRPSVTLAACVGSAVLRRPPEV
ncbi:hypothetical protein E4K10_47030 [Streptomyces sp. T1317-0309]|nr:hypothetical protein E4K10_47030 [Streptomyces sp. T1317-0309]